MLQKYINSNQKNSEIKDCKLYLGNISKKFTINNMKKNGIRRSSKNLFCWFNPIDTNGILDFHKYLMKEKQYKIMFGVIKKMFTRLLICIVNVSNHTKCVSLSNQRCIIQPILINLHPNEYSQEVHYYPFAVKVDWCVGSCNTLNDLSNKVCVLHKTQDLNLSMFNMFTRIN